MTGADIAVIGIVVLTGLIAFSLGLVRVVLSLLGWVGAGLATLYGFRYVQPIARQWISVGLLADAAAAISIFIVALIVLTMISHAIGRHVRGSGLSALDRSLGLVFGLGLGSLLVCLGYLGVLWAVDMPSRPEDQPKWIREARTRPLLEWGAERISLLVPPEWRSQQLALPRPGDSRLDVERAMKRLVVPETKPTGPPPQRHGYTDRERHQMDRLIRGQE